MFPHKNYLVFEMSHILFLFLLIRGSGASLFRDITVHSRAVATQENDHSRSISEVVYSCTATLVLCLWYCIRPNISSPNSSWFRLLKRKLNIAFWMFISPELIIVWALNQWYEGNKFARKYRARRWTAMHGQFAVMGGFLLFKDGMPNQVLSPEKFTTLVDAGCIDFPSITEHDIKEKSKAHPLLTFLTFLQTLWFISQCVVRRHFITLLEMMTLAFIVMHALLLFFWWHKPLDARDAIRLNLIHIPPLPIPNPPDVHETNAGIKWDFSRENTLSKRVKVVLRSELLLGIRKRDPTPIRILKACLIAPINLFEKLFTDFGELFLRVETAKVPEGATEMFLFYAPDTNNYLGPSLFAFENVLGFFFAFSHILMLWFFDFPTHRDLVVWRISCVVSAGLPLLFIAGSCFLVAITAVSMSFMNQITDIILKAAQVFAVIVVTLGFVAILVGRVTLIVEAFISLKALSGSSRLSVPWTNYIPHLS